MLHAVQKASCNGSISVNNFFFLDFFNFCWVFQKFPFFCVTLYFNREGMFRYRKEGSEFVSQMYTIVSCGDKWAFSSSLIGGRVSTQVH